MPVGYINSFTRQQQWVQPSGNGLGEEDICRRVTENASYIISGTDTRRATRGVAH
jgi:hypothetical protein